MSMESALTTLLLNRCPRVFQMVVPPGTVPARPYVVWQEIGGRTLRYLDNAAADKRNVLLQIAVWADKSGDARDLIRQLEDDLCASAAMTAEPQGEHLAQYDEATSFYGAVQRLSITAART